MLQKEVSKMKLLIVLTLLFSSLTTFAYDTPFKRSRRIEVTCSSGAKILFAKKETSDWDYLISGYAKKCRISNWSCYPMYKIKTGLSAADKEGLSAYAITKLEEDCKEDSDAMASFLQASEDYCYGYDSNAWYQTNKLASGRLWKQNRSKKESVKKKYGYYKWESKSAASLSSSERSQIEQYHAAMDSLTASLKKSYHSDLEAVKMKYHGPYLKAQCCSGSQCRPL